VITVGSAVGAQLSDFSNAGEAVDIYAPGEAVLSASIRDICGYETGAFAGEIERFVLDDVDTANDVLCVAETRVE